MLPYLIPIVLTGVGLVADYYIRSEVAEKAKKPRVIEGGETKDVVLPNDSPLSFGQWVQKMPTETKVLAVATVAGSIAMIQKTRK